MEITTLGAIGIRLIVELVCKAEGCKDRGLMDKIESFRKRALINQDVADAIHGVRFFGNDAAHEYRVKKYELSAAWDTVNMLINNIYGSRDNRETLLSGGREARLLAERARRTSKN